MTKAKRRKKADREEAANTISSMLSGELEIYIGYRRLYKLWCARNSSVPELKPLFRIPGIEPDGVLHITDEFREAVMLEIRKILSLISQWPPQKRQVARPNNKD